MIYATLHFAVNEEVVLEERLKALRDIGYERQAKVDVPGTFSHRGGVVDVFPWGHSFPIRVEFAHETVNAIYTFDPTSGSLLEPHKMVVVLPLGDRALRYHGKKLSWAWGEQPINPFVDLEKGDYVVHVVHGIGCYQGIEKLTGKDGEVKPHLALEYAEGEKLYVPLSDLHLVQRYIAFGRHPAKGEKHIRLSKLGSKLWQRIRERARKGILSYASELLEVQAKRELIHGYTYSADTSWQQQLEKEFPFEETPDQAKATSEVKRDMEQRRPMDRLICGDVGYGKTEVALRAAFKAIMDGKQVAILVPTTILAEQHYETFRERYRSFPAEVEMLSRFQPASAQGDIVRRLSSGQCDLVIGTHRLLSDDVTFKNLGLLIIDEEQRFGVRHKERLKKYRLEVDVLTLTATPIPRTLYLSLVGGKDMSVIQTPPQNRLPIRTRVVPFEDRLIREAMRRELERRGQAFFVHNRVEGIEKISGRLRALMPEARIGVAHGQMNARELEAVMRDFIHRQIDLLVSTTIVESGIDIPNANTLFINHAEAFGLSELYQLKGRIGRFTRQAYAYFLIPKGKSLSYESQRRLDAIMRHEHLGAGFNIAMEDLEIRGGGNLLGTEQSGFITAIGFDLYCRLLKDAIVNLKKVERAD